MTLPHTLMTEVVKMTVVVVVEKEVVVLVVVVVAVVVAVVVVVVVACGFRNCRKILNADSLETYGTA